MRKPQHQQTSGRRGRRSLALIAALLVGSLLAAACGGGDSKASDTTKAGDTKPAAFTGAPIKVMTETAIDTNDTPYENIRDTSKYYAQWVNEQGGLKTADGKTHELQVTFCDDKYDANEAANCARKAVEEKMVANVGGFTYDVSRAIAIYEENKIAWFGVCCPIVDQENKSKVSFPLGFVGGFLPAAAIKMNQDGCKKVIDGEGELPVADVFHGLFMNGWKSVGRNADDVKLIKFPQAPGDFSSQIAQIPADADCFYGQLGEALWPSILTAAKKLGKNIRWYGPQGNLDQKVATDYPVETEGAIIIGVYPDISSPAFKEYRDALAKYSASDKIDWNSLGGLGTWTAYVAFTDIISKMSGEPTGPAFLEAANKTTALDTKGILPKIDFTKEWTGGGGAFPRIFNRVQYFSVIKGGKLSPLEGSVDTSNPVDGKPA